MACVRYRSWIGICGLVATTLLDAKIHFNLTFGHLVIIKNLIVYQKASLTKNDYVLKILLLLEV